MINAGELDRVVQVQQPSDVEDADGFVDPKAGPGWTAFGNPVWAKRTDVRGSERVKASQEIATRTAIFRMHYLEGLTTSMRLVEDGLAWDILGLAEIGRRQGWDVTAEAKVA